ncbi:hypothetical protein [Geotalea uraniireducens]|uniref:DUF3108 domain-containing protein n=1 Tax=Geotalea uraniireducens (strain Rf4) TaxID=351605 RepID=A5G4N1_GEOUR|nr:hypothetical protein [Geotalea uraniireducens]ABQ26749.1 hypothetical protein Gura_2571 [Geotalea uraniireducens Rf4]
MELSENQGGTAALRLKKRLQIRLNNVIACILMIACVTGSVASTGPETRESSYAIFARGFRVGELKTVCSLVPATGKKILKFESATRVNANLVFYSYSLVGKEEALVGNDGAFQYKHTAKENKSSLQVEGKLENGLFQFEVSEKGSRRTVAIERKKYDYTTMECPEVAMKKPGEKMSLRVLDLENLEVLTRSYRYVRNEEVDVDGVRLMCKVIDFEDSHKKCRRWIKADDLGVVIARQDGSGKNGSYSLRMTKLNAA